MPVVDAVWASSCDAGSSIDDSPSTSSSGPSAFKQQLVLLIEVLLDFMRFFSAEQDPGLGSCFDDDSDDDRPSQATAAASQAAVPLNPSLLQSLLQLLQVAYGGSLADCDRAILRVLLLLDHLIPAPPAHLGSSGGSDAAGNGATTVAEAPRQQLPWPRCLFGTAAKLYYEQQQRQQGSAASSAALALFQQQLLRDMSPLEPLRCAGFAACGLLGVVLRALAAEDDELRFLAYTCLGRLTTLLAQEPPPQAHTATTAAAEAAGGGGGTSHRAQTERRKQLQSHSLQQQLLKSSKHSHQLQALLNFVNAGVSSLSPFPHANPGQSADIHLLQQFGGLKVVLASNALHVLRNVLQLLITDFLTHRVVRASCCLMDVEAS
eukprot:gene8610-8791_t